MQEKKQKIKYIVANLIAPGVGQLLMKKWFRGSIQLLGSITCVIWMLVAFVDIMVDNIYRAMDGTKIHTSLYDLFIPMVVLIIWWIYSYIDLIFFCTELHPKTESDDHKI